MTSLTWQVCKSSANQQPDDERVSTKNCLVQTLLKLSAKKTSWQVSSQVLWKKGGVMTMEAAQEYTRTAMETIKAKALEEKYADYKAENEKFLAENKTKDGVKTTASGLQYKVITEGKGEIPADTCKVKVNYKGTLIDGTEFDSSYKRNEPSTFRANQVIKGWTEALTMMPVGSKWELYIPQELAYGARESGNQIKPFSTLIFEVELLSIEKDKK